MQSKANTVDDYLQELPPDRREAISQIREILVQHLPPEIEERMQYGMIGYVVPLAVYPPGYLNDPKTPLPFAALASQKNYMALYLMHLYSDTKTDQWFRDEYRKSGKKMDIGKSCIRFKKIEDLPLDLVVEALSRITVAEYIQRYEAGRKK